ncbi:syntaxin-like protein [Moniliophthora roreri MCA 2997]|uniref:Syntaxin-like protein n=2 Tax=Moniliophthora roreri TaxID=221103 RepID=V2WW19_MONRO|nr:syntaxin-like protein [Moniliophthora roreri MCA 2997]KAI3616554.1 syntaxin-like protein [Moniliophthora roreri]
MPQDRLAAARAQRQHGESEHEMSMVRNGVQPEASTTQQFLTEITTLQASVSQLSSNIRTIRDLHLQSINSTQPSSSNAVSETLDSTVEDTRALCNRIKHQIETLGNDTKDLGIKGKLTQQEGEMRMNRLAHVRSKFVETLQEYQRVEQDHRVKVRERAERQFRMVQPDATPEQVRQAVESDSGSQIFMQALMNVDSSKYAESRNAYTEVQSRHEEIKKLERSMAELATLMNDMATLTQQQDYSFTVIEDKAADIEADTRKGVEHTDRAVVLARAIRRKKWICFGIFVFVLVVIAIVLAAYFGTRK